MQPDPVHRSATNSGAATDEESSEEAEEVRGPGASENAADDSAAGRSTSVASCAARAASSSSDSASVMRESSAHGLPAAGRRASASLTSTSVSGRGMSTPGRTFTATWRNATSPVMYCKGSPLPRRNT